MKTMELLIIEQLSYANKLIYLISYIYVFNFISCLQEPRHTCACLTDEETEAWVKTLIQTHN